LQESKQLLLHIHYIFSTDNGATWPSPGVVTAPITSFTSLGTNIFFGMNGQGVAVSINGGSTWTLANTGITNFIFIP